MKITLEQVYNGWYVEISDALRPIMRVVFEDLTYLGAINGAMKIWELESGKVWKLEEKDQ